MTRFRALLSLAVFGLLVHSAAASDVTATIRIRIVSPTPLPAKVTVELATWPFSSTAEIFEGSRPVIVRTLPAGTYRMTARLSGYLDAVADVHLEAAAHNEYVIEFRQSADSTIRLVSSEPVRTVRTFDERLLESFPGDDSLAAVVETAVAPLIVDRISNGGLWVGEAALIGGQGSSWRQTSITLDNLDVTDPARIGTPLVRPSQSSIAALVVSTTLLPASVGGPGPSLTLIPKPPATTWRGSVGAGFISPALQAAQDPKDPPPIARFDTLREWNGDVGGPLASRAGFFVSARRIGADRIERTDPDPLSTDVSSIAGTVAIAGSQGQVRVAGGVDRASIPYAGRARFRNRDVSETDTFTTAQLSWDRSMSSGTTWSASAGVAQGTFTPTFPPMFDNGDLSSRVAAAGTVERLNDGPVPTLFDGMPATRRRITGRFEITPSLGRLGAGQLLQAGATVARNTAVTIGRASPPAAELVDGLPARIWDYAYRAPESHWASTEVAAYLTDRLMLGSRATVDAGVRLESVGGSARGGDNSIEWLSALPRVSGRWVIDSKHRFSINGGYARYAHRLPLDYFAYGDPAAATGQVYRWNDLNGDHLLQANEYGALVAAVGPCCNATALNRIDPDLRRPSTDEGVVGVEGRLGGWSVRISYVKRHEQDLVGLVNTGATDAAYSLRYVSDPGEPFRDPPVVRPLPVYDRLPSSFGLDQYILTNPPVTVGSYGGFEVSIDGRITDRVRTRFDGSSYQGWVIAGNRGFRPLENDPGVIGELFDNPNAQTYAYGHGFVDRGYVIKWWGQYTAPRGYAVAAVARYQDGQPFSRLAIVPDLSQGPEAINGYRLGRTRFTFTLSLDAHVEKTFSVAGARVAGIVDVFNLLNTRNEVEEDVTTGLTFRVPTAIQPPRAARLGFRITFD